MPRIRTIKPEFWSDPTIATLDFFTRLFYIGLWNFADDYGRGRANAKELNGFIFPNDDVENAQVETALRELDAKGRITLYEHEGQRFFQVVHWQEHQKVNRPSESRIQPPDGFTEASLNPHGDNTEASTPSRVRAGSGKQEAGIRNKEAGAGSREEECEEKPADAVSLPARPPFVASDFPALPLSLREEVRQVLTEIEVGDLLRSGWTEAEITESVQILRERKRDGKPPPENPKGYLHKAILPDVRAGKRANPPPKPVATLTETDDDVRRRIQANMDRLNAKHRGGALEPNPP